eukprot:Filipodium_phascolosomae@DN2352_c0_g1_i1.p1
MDPRWLGLCFFSRGCSEQMHRRVCNGSSAKALLLIAMILSLQIGTAVVQVAAAPPGNNIYVGENTVVYEGPGGTVQIEGDRIIMHTPDVESVVISGPGGSTMVSGDATYITGDGGQSGSGSGSSGSGKGAPLLRRSEAVAPLPASSDIYVAGDTTVVQGPGGTVVIDGDRVVTTTPGGVVVSGPAGSTVVGGAGTYVRGDGGKSGGSSSSGTDSYS